MRVATGDFNGDGIADIITGGAPAASVDRSRSSEASCCLLQSFLAYDGFGGGVFVASVQPVPEPGTAALLGVGVMLLGRRKK